MKDTCKMARFPLGILWTFLFMCLMHQLRAQTPVVLDSVLSFSEKSLSYGHQFSIHSEAMDQNRTYDLYLPEGFAQDSEAHTYPVLLVLEDEFFFTICGLIRHLASVERMPPTLVVGLREEPNLPKLYTNGSGFWPATWTQLPFGTNPDPFTNHLREELFPYLEKHFRANDFRMVLGLSGTAIFPLHALLKEPGLFKVYIALAAGDILGMGYAPGERIVDLIAQKAVEHSLKKEYLYVASADADVAMDPQIGENLTQLQTKLDPLKDGPLVAKSKIFSNEGHYDLTVPALWEAMELVFPRAKWSANYRKMVEQPGTALENLDAYYKELSQEYGFTILPKADRWNSINSLWALGPYLFRQNRQEEALAVLGRWASYKKGAYGPIMAKAEYHELMEEHEKALELLQSAQQKMEDPYSKTKIIEKIAMIQKKLEGQ